MKKAYFIISLVVFALFVQMPAQAQIVSEQSKLQPIVQVFSSAQYDLAANSYSYGFTRSHIGFNYQFDEKWSAKIILDRDGSRMYLKFASLKWQPTERFSLESGAILQNHYITQERFWGLRYVAQTFQDMYWGIPSSDLGFMARFKVNDYISIDAALTNGEGPKIAQDSKGRIKIASGIDFEIGQKITTRLYGHYYQLPDKLQQHEQLYSAFIGVRPSERVRVGTEYNYRRRIDYNGLNISQGISVFGAWQVKPKAELFARYDFIANAFDKTNRPINDSYNDGHTFIGGVSITPVDKINVSLNYQHHHSKNNMQFEGSRVMLSLEYKF